LGDLIKYLNYRNGKMKKNFIFLLMVVLVLAFFSSSQAQCPCWPGDLVGTNCCGECSFPPDDPEYSVDLGICDTVYVVPWPHTDTCFYVTIDTTIVGPDTTIDTTCHYQINNPGESFPCFLYVNLFVTHDSNTFWDTTLVPKGWKQDSIVAFVIPLTFWHHPEGCADSVIFPFESQSWNNPDINPYYPWMDQSMFRHFVDSRTGDTVYYNRMLQMVESGKGAWNVYTDIESHSSDGDPGHVFFSCVLISPNCQRWWEGSRVLLATLTFQVYMSEDYDTTEICFDSIFWPPLSHLTFGRLDAKVYFPRHFLPICDTVYTGIRWIEGSTEEESRPTTFSVSQNYPNPFNPVTNFRVALPQASHVKIEIFNILGQKVKTLVDEDMRAGIFIVDWDGKDKRGLEVSSGIYFYRIVAGEFSDIKKMVLLK
jgi:hypothetical protein